MGFWEGGDVSMLDITETQKYENFSVSEDYNYLMTKVSTRDMQENGGEGGRGDCGAEFGM